METRPINESLKDMITQIRQITPEDLHLTTIALKNWHDQMQAEFESDPYVSMERKWNAFKRALPPQVRKAFTAIDNIDTEIRASLYQEKLAEIKAKEAQKKEDEPKRSQREIEEKARGEVSSDAMTAKWSQILNPKKTDPSKAPSINLNEEDIYEVYAKLDYLYGKVFEPYTVEENLITQHIKFGARLNEYLSDAFNLDEVFNVKLPDQNELEEIKQKKDAIENKFKEKYDAVKAVQLSEEQLKSLKLETAPEKLTNEQITKLNAKLSADRNIELRPYNKREGELSMLANKPYDDAKEALAKTVQTEGKAVTKNESAKSLIEQFIIDAEREKVIPLFGDRKAGFNEIRNYLRDKEFDSDEAYRLIKSLKDIADSKIRDKKIIDLGEKKLSNMCQTVLNHLAPEKNIYQTSSLLFQKRTETERETQPKPTIDQGKKYNG